LAGDDVTLLVEELRAGYGAIEVLHGVNFAANKGEAIGIFGRNGAGKSTLLESLAGVLSVKRGSVLLEGTQVAGKPSYRVARRGVALVPQWRGLFPGLSTIDNLRLGCRGLRLSRTATRARLAEILEQFPALAARRDVRANALSGGEQQILAIAKALVRDPTVLLLDEPSIGLAPIIVDQVAEVIQGLRGSNRLIVVTEQRIDWALDAVDRGYVIEGGQFVDELHPSDRATWESKVETFLGTTIAEVKTDDNPFEEFRNSGKATND
jgi:branched-chain amino acid transport system ATP-binding protein